MVDLFDAVLPIATLALSSLLTVPLFKVFSRAKHRAILIIGWFLVVFAAASFSVANLATKYFAKATAEPFVNLTLSSGSQPSLSSAFMIDTVSIYMSIIFVLVGAVAFLYSIFYIDTTEKPAGRYLAVMLMLTAVLVGSAFAGDLLTLFIFWEAAAAGSSFLMLYKKTPSSLHATLKYLVMVIMASAFIVFGLSLVYGLTGTLNYWAVRQALTELSDKHLLVLAFVFIATGYAIEAAIVPFHMWLPDAYTEAPSSSSAFLSALIDQGSYYVLIRVLLFILTPPGILNWTVMLAGLAALTMVVGNLFALIQDNVKRLIANICVADVGYNLVAITSVTPLGLQGNLYFFLLGGITTALSFMSVGIINKQGYKTLEDFSGIGRKMPLTSLALLVAALSFAGVPPLGGFIAKFLVFTAAIEANMSWLAVIGVLTSVLQTAYLFRLVNYMYARKSKDEAKIKEPKQLLIPVYILTAAIIILGLYPTIVLNLIQPVAHQLSLIT
jgi:proton-translocating NADH-quinone oxidoreductase chain N